MTQTEMILRYLEENRTISAYEAVMELGILQLSARICELESGKRQMSLTELKAYRNFFKVNFEYLLGYGEKVQFTALHQLIADINTTEIASHLNNMDEWTAKWRAEAEKALYKISEDCLK